MVYIYAIQHNVTKKMYIGSTQDICQRYCQHISSLRSNRHRSIEMQADFDKYGEDYSLYILEEIDGEKKVPYSNCSWSRKREVDWMLKYDTLENGYNIQDHVAQKMVGRQRSITVSIAPGIPEEPSK